MNNVSLQPSLGSYSIGLLAGALAAFALLMAFIGEALATATFALPVLAASAWMYKATRADE